ncbi:FMN-binding negative transcriptional regulator [Albimonas sp. CAU 1670]|uniref:FMN-binding negative transcriptional regulator n=1 Tax=Albimonas sp. CAU 1670 TaxID=3032599 RepID=UPI0023DA9975|nr:FMN-binding negative transcriptional regulator [Albimonas sp. CAU 1670]MDF2233302.1 FMN-binding negative transcriptional regulator [Albimonas sp. CAU 1670]
MHPNPAFRKSTRAHHLALAKARGFGTLVVSAEPFPLISHVPFVMETDGAADLHLVRSNPIARRLAEGPAAAVLAVQGADGYVSPDWYGDPGQVPTWNYVAAHLRGRLSLREPEALRPHLAALSARFEGALPGKKPWTLDKMDRGTLEKMERMILPVRLEIEETDGTWKLGQNKPEAMRLGAAEAMPGSIGAELETLAALMREPPV